jgi:hypothetical protein
MAWSSLFDLLVSACADRPCRELPRSMGWREEWRSGQTKVKALIGLQ